jgi:hypothetical protein
MQFGRLAMTSATPQRSRRATGLRAVALVALASLSCTTVRAPASGIAPTVEVRGHVAEPQVELWVESGERVSAEEVAKAAADARAALQAALAGRRMSEGEQMLVVRAQAVSRTASRRSDQKAAVAGIVIGAVAVVAIVVVAIVASGGKGGGGKLPAAVPGLPGRGPSAAGVRPAPVPVAVPRPAPPRGVAAVPRPSGSRHPHVGVAIGADVHVGGGVGAPADGAPPPGLVGHAVVAGPVSAPPPDGPPPAELVLPGLPPLDVSQRGFFAKDATRLELTLVDRATLAPLWVKTVEDDCDLRDADAVRALLDRALDDPGGWAPAPPTP